MKSLRNRLLLLLGVAIITANLIQFAASFSAAMGQANRLFDAQMRQIAEYLILSNGSPDAEDSDIRTHFDLVVQIWRADKVKVYQERQHRMLPHRAEPGFSNVHLDNGEWRVFAAPFEGGVVQVAQKLAARQAEAITLAVNTLWPMLLVSVLLLAAMAYVVSAALRPLKSAGKELAGRDARSLDPVSVGTVPAEVQPVFLALNNLLARVSDALAQQHQFIANAAHELRSPLTVLKVQLQLLSRAGDEAARQTALQSLSQAIERSSRMVEQLLALAREDALNQTLPAPTSADLVASATEAIIDIADLAARKHIDLTFLNATPVNVAIDPDGLQILLRNLLDNAVRYTPAEGAVTISVERVGEQGILQIADSGPGIADDELAHVTERFYRVPGTSESGSGLGLAIVATIVERAGAELALHNSSTGGLVARLAFRLA
jgi:two-component system OmpR family sensor kinase